MKLTSEEGRGLVYEDLLGWSDPIDKHVIDQRRWVTVWSAIFKHEESGRHFRVAWEEGSTEAQDLSAFEYTEPELTEVHQVEQTVKVWEKIK